MRPLGTSLEQHNFDTLTLTLFKPVPDDSHPFPLSDTLNSGLAVAWTFRWPWVQLVYTFETLHGTYCSFKPLWKSLAKDFDILWNVLFRLMRLSDSVPPRGKKVFEKQEGKKSSIWLKLNTFCMQPANLAKLVTALRASRSLGGCPVSVTCPGRPVQTCQPPHSVM